MIKQYCEEEKIKGLLVGVDARKAFDSVDHECMQKVLKSYGFGPKFINWVKIPFYIIIISYKLTTCILHKA